MKHSSLICKLSVLALVLLAGWTNVSACSVEFPPLRKDFRKSEHVFVGEVVEILDLPSSFSGQRGTHPMGAVRFRIEKSWKGSSAKEITLPSDIVSFLCDELKQFEKGQKYLVFARRDYAGTQFSTKYEAAGPKMRRLDDFWFRTWARLYPF